MHIRGIELFHRHEVLEMEIPLLLVFNPIFITILLSGIPFQEPPYPTLPTHNPERDLAISPVASRNPPQHTHPISSSR